jgi:outer membrane protein OmpA-like peptidoglycan-associated protein
MYERFVDEAFDELAEEYDAGYDEDLFGDVGFEEDGFEEDGFEEFLDEVVDEALDAVTRGRRSVTSPLCPGPTRLTVSGFPRYQNTAASLPPSEQQKLRLLAQRIVRSYQGGCRPIQVVRLIGHADRDVQRGRPFESRISRERALAVRHALERLIDNRVISSRIRWDVYGTGSSQLVVQNPRPEGERSRNRRVEVLFAQRVHPRPPRPRPRARPLDILIDAPRPNEEFFIEPGAFDRSIDPVMPFVKVLGRVLSNGQLVPNAQITWAFKISGVYRVRSEPGNRCGTVDRCRLQDYVFDIGRVVTTSGRQDFIELRHLTTLTVGGNLDIEATTRDAAGRTVRKTVRCKISGRNPDRQAVEQMIGTLGRNGPCGDDSWALLRIFCHESGHTLHQFTRNGNVLFGPPAGVGITQRDPEVKEWGFPRDAITQTQPNNFFPRIFWNWQENVREGIQFFRTHKLPDARRDLRALQQRAQQQGLQLPDPCIGVVMRAAIRRFNGGTEYSFRRTDPGSASFVVHPRTIETNLEYVNQVLGDHRHPQIALPPVPNNARHVRAPEFSAADLPCDACPA